MTTKDVVYFSLFRNLDISVRGKNVSLSSYLSKKLVAIIELLILGSENGVSADELCQYLWPNSDSPKNTLKYSIHRLRNELDQISDLKGIDLISTTKTGYCLSKEYSYVIDVYEFDKLEAKIKSEPASAEVMMGRIQKLQKLYRGPLYTISGCPVKLEKLKVYYRYRYIDAIEKIADAMLENGQYEQVISFLQPSLNSEPNCEKFHEIYLKAVLATKGPLIAKDYYNSICSSASERSGKPLSTEMIELGTRIFEAEVKAEEDASIDQVLNLLNANPKTSGGFYCDSKSFSLMYELLLKEAKRQSRRMFAVMIKFDHKSDVSALSQSVSDILRTRIGKYIRETDVFTEINNQRFMLLCSCQEEVNTKQIISRIEEGLLADHILLDLKLTCTVREIKVK